MIFKQTTLAGTWRKTKLKAAKQPAIGHGVSMAVLQTKTNNSVCPGRSQPNRAVTTCVAFLSLVSWVSGLVLHDSWLRPWPKIVLGCAFLTAIWVVTGFVLRYGRVVIGIAIVLATLSGLVLLGLPSVKRTAIIDNRTSSEIVVYIAKRNGHGAKSFRIPGQRQSKFVYFLGDTSPQTESSIPARLDVNHVSTNAKGTRDIELSLYHDETIQVTDEWFKRN